MLDRLARAVVRRRVAVLIGTLVFIVAAAAIGGSVSKHLTTGGFDDPNAESSQVRRLVEREFPKGATPNVVLLVTAKEGTVDSPAVADAGERLTVEVGGLPSVHGVAFSYWT